MRKAKILGEAQQEDKLMMTKRVMGMLIASLLLGPLVRSHASTAPVPIPNPVLYLTSVEPLQQAGKTVLRYHFDVLNKDSYPADFFAPSPNLPPCGANTKAS